MSRRLDGAAKVNCPLTSSVRGSGRPYGDVVAVADVDLTVADGEFFNAARAVGVGQDDDPAALIAGSSGPTPGASRSRRRHHAAAPYARDVTPCSGLRTSSAHDRRRNVGYG